MKATKPFGLRLFALLAIFALVVAACTSDTTDTTEGGDGAPVTTEGGDGTTDTTEGDDGGPVVEGGTFQVGFISNITTDNWWASLDTLSSTYNQAFLGNAHTQLFTLTNPGFVYVPGAAATDEPVKAVQEGDVWVVEAAGHRSDGLVRWDPD